MTSTDELRRMLDERGVEYEVDERNAITKWSTHYGAFVFFARQREGKLLVETTVATEHSVILTPDQAIAATLGSDREKALEELVRDMWREITTCPDYQTPPCMTRNICDRIRELGIEVDDDER